MRILFIDIASHDGLIALCTQEAVIALKRIDHRIEDHELISCFESVLKKAKWKCAEITHIACVIGPGGFTSLRVGVAFANALAWSLKIPIAGIHLSDWYAARVMVSRCHGESCLPGVALAKTGRTTNHDKFVWLHSTKKNELFVRGFGTYSKKWPKPTHISLDEMPGNIYWIGELLPEHIQPSWKEVPLQGVEQVLPQFLQEQTYGAAMLTPWYGRKG